jgi:hypothetical protein
MDAFFASVARPEVQARAITKFKFMCRNGKSFWHQVQWDRKAAVLSPLGETDERKARKKLLESE